MLGEREKYVWIWILLFMPLATRACERLQRTEGCKIVFSQAGVECVCGLGCKREFPFQYRHSCEAALLKQFQDTLPVESPCDPSPCSHSGECIPLGAGGFLCQCTGTGYYGTTCEKECPKRLGLNALGLAER